MDDDNPLRRVELGVRDEVKRALDFSDEKWRTLDNATDCRVMWGFVEEVLGRYDRTARIDFVAMRLLVPSTLVDDEARRIFAWVLFADAARAIRNLAMIRVKILFESLERALLVRDLLTSCVLARALVEHAAFVDHIVLKLDQTPLGPPLRGEVSASEFMVAGFPTRETTAVLERVMVGSRFNWTELGQTPAISSKDLERARKRLFPGELSYNVMTILDDLEKERGRPGLRGDYERLCDCVHPSRGSLEILYSGKDVIEGDDFSVVYSANQPSDEAFVERLRSLVAPALKHVFVAVLSLSSRLVPLLDEMSGGGRNSMKARGYDIGALYIAAHKEMVRQDSSS